MDQAIQEAIARCEWHRWFTFQERIGGLENKILVEAFNLAALFNHARIQGMGFFQAAKTITQGIPSVMSVEEACYILFFNQSNPNGKYFDYFRGRVLKVDLERLDFGLYDRDNGLGAGDRALICKGCKKCQIK